MKPAPIPTPEFVAALANVIIDEVKNNGATMEAAAETAWREYAKADRASPHAALALIAAGTMAMSLDFPQPYEVTITIKGREPITRRCTVAAFWDEEGVSEADWAAISVLEIGESYVVQHEQATMMVLRRF